MKFLEEEDEIYLSFSSYKINLIAIKRQEMLSRIKLINRHAESIYEE